MKKIYLFAVPALLATTSLLTSCGDDDDALLLEPPTYVTPSGTETNDAVALSEDFGTQASDVVTGDTVEVGKFAASVLASCDEAKLEGIKYTLGVAYSMTNAEPTEADGWVVAKKADGEDGYKVALSPLLADTTYYYRTCIVVGQKRFYGDVCQFATAPFDGVATGDTCEVTQWNAILACEIDFDALQDVDFDAGVVYSRINAVPMADSANCIVKSAGKIAAGSFNVALDALDIEACYNYRTYVRVGDGYYYGNVRMFSTKEYEPVAAEYVDLGLSVKWAAWNVGAKQPEEYGDYFAWGATLPQRHYYVEDCATWMKTVDALKGNSIVDNKGNLTADYDVAAVKWGGGWRMPTADELKELKEKCDWKWTERNGVKGYDIRKKNDKDKTGPSIFLPMGGRRYEASVYDAGSDAFYWSSSVMDGESYANGFRLSQDYQDGHFYGRYEGFLVRPVTK